NLSGQNLNTEEKPNLTRLETQDKTEK
ncbi:Sec-independent protein translocase TatB, partial [Campylobacter jejuni]|nr:Sec-independent protein translocase TatB [Campylobacter jejuni]